MSVEETKITAKMIEDTVMSDEIFRIKKRGPKTFIGQKLGEAVNRNASGGK